MRVSEYVVIQLVDGETPDEDQLVFVDDRDGAELAVPRRSWPLLQYAITYLSGDQWGVQNGVHEHHYEPLTIGTDPHGSAVEVNQCRCGAVGGFNRAS